jgi:glucokinase
VAGEIRLLRNKLDARMNAEEGASIRAVRRAYAREAGIGIDEAPQPREIFEIARGAGAGDRAAAVEAFRRLGEVAGDAIAQASALVDGLVVVGGGLSAAWPLFLPALVQEMNATYESPEGEASRRLTPVAFNLEEPAELQRFVESETRTLAVPGGDRRVAYDALARTGVGVSRLGTSDAVAVGAYVFALEKLDARRATLPADGRGV